MMQKPYFSFLLLFFFLLPITSQASQEVVAKVIALRNSATATSISGEVRKLKSKSPVHKGDTIQTGKRGRIQILFTDNTIISLGRNANLSIHEYLWQPEQKKGALHTEVKEGIFRIMGGAITQTSPEQFTTKTPAATIGIRGSMYAGRVSGNTLAVVFQGGRGIFVENEHGHVEIPTPGYGTNVRENQAPPQAIRFTPDEINALIPSADLPPEEDSGSSSTQPNDTSSDDSPDDDSETPPPSDEGTDPPPLAGADEPSTSEGEAPPPLAESTTPTSIAPELPPVNETTPPPIEYTPWAPPSTGITHFMGNISGASTTGSINEPIDVFANWQNNTLIGFSKGSNDPQIPAIFFGSISGTDVTDITFFGNSDGTSEISVIEGSGSGFFDGTVYGQFNLSGNGTDWAVEPYPQTQTGTWSVSGIAQEDATKPALTGTSTWKGYVVGLSEDMNNIQVNRHLTRNTDHDQFIMNIDKNGGTVSGSMTASGSGVTTSLNIGQGAQRSAYVHDYLLGAFLTGSVSSGSLKNHGNYLISGPLDEQNMEYATWGYWEIAYEYMATNEYHNHVPGALWISGEPTAVSELIALGSAIGHYSGDVHSSRIDSVGNVSEIGGSFQMDVDFSLAVSGAASAFTGTMNINGLATFDIHSVAGATTGNGRFSDGLMNNFDGFTGQVSGTLYGPNATSIGGNFTTTDGADVYQGIYGGNR